MPAATDLYRSPLFILKCLHLIFNIAILICVANQPFSLYPYEAEFVHLMSEGWFVINLIMFLSFFFGGFLHKYIQCMISGVGGLFNIVAAAFLFNAPDYLTGREVPGGILLILLAFIYWAETFFTIKTPVE